MARPQHFFSLKGSSPHLAGASSDMSSGALDRAGDLLLTARTLADGLLAGRHRTLDAGGSTDFYEYRVAAAGDPVKLIDWRVFGRTDRQYIRRFEHEARLTVTIIVDASASMGFVSMTPSSRRRVQTDQREVLLSKLDRARQLAAAIACLAIRQGDRAALIVQTDQAEPVVVPAASGWSTARRITEALERLKPAGSAGLVRGLTSARRYVSRSGLLVAIGDCLEETEPLLSAAAKLRYAGARPTIGARCDALGCDIALMQVLADDELDFPQRGVARLLDPEGGRAVTAHGQSVADDYRSRIKAHNQTLRRGMEALQGRCILCRTGDDPATPLLELLTAQ